MATKRMRNTRYMSPKKTRSGCSRLQSCPQPREGACPSGKALQVSGGGAGERSPRCTAGAIRPRRTKLEGAGAGAAHLLRPRPRRESAAGPTASCRPSSLRPAQGLPRGCTWLNAAAEPLDPHLARAASPLISPCRTRQPPAAQSTGLHPARWRGGCGRGDVGYRRGRITVEKLPAGILAGRMGYGCGEGCARGKGTWGHSTFWSWMSWERQHWSSSWQMSPKKTAK